MVRNRVAGVGDCAILRAWFVMKSVLEVMLLYMEILANVSVA